MTLYDLIIKLRLAAIAEVQRREEMVLRLDIARLLAAGHQEDFEHGWPHHKDFAGVPGWPDVQERLRDWRN